MTADEAADFLRISRSHLYALASEGVIPSVRIGRSVRFVERDLIAALRRGADVS